MFTHRKSGTIHLTHFQLEEKAPIQTQKSTEPIKIEHVYASNEIFASPDDFTLKPIFLSASSSEARASRNHFFFSLRTLMNCDSAC